MDLHVPDPPLRGDGFTLRPWRPSDASSVADACSDPVTQRFITFLPRPYTLHDAKDFIRRTAKTLEAGRAIALAISHPETGQAIGAVTLHTDEPARWGIGYWVAPAWRNRGIASRVVSTVSRWAFAEYPALVRLSLYVLPDNLASRRVAAHTGFREEGLLRSFDVSSHSPADVALYALVRGDLSTTPGLHNRRR